MQVPLEHLNNLWSGYNDVMHLSLGLILGLMLPWTRPLWAFWGASFAGVLKETTDVLKHMHQIPGFDFLTHPQYGLHDALQDLFGWMLGGYCAYALLHAMQLRWRKRFQSHL